MSNWIGPTAKSIKEARNKIAKQQKIIKPTQTIKALKTQLDVLSATRNQIVASPKEAAIRDMNENAYTILARSSIPRLLKYIEELEAML